MTQATTQNDWVLGFEDVAYHGVSRRAFLLSGAGVAFGVTFGGTLAGISEVFAQSGEFAPNGWVRVAADAASPCTRPRPKWDRA